MEGAIDLEPCNRNRVIWKVPSRCLGMFTVGRVWAIAWSGMERWCHGLCGKPGGRPFDVPGCQIIGRHLMLTGRHGAVAPGATGEFMAECGMSHGQGRRTGALVLWGVHWGVQGRPRAP